MVLLTVVSYLSLVRPAVPISGDEWRAPAEDRIEKIRKGEMRLKFVDQKGNPIVNAPIEIEQINSDFRFGTTIKTEHILGDSVDDIRYREELVRHFNTVNLSTELNWGALDSQPDSVNRARRSLDWIKKQGFLVRGHALMTGSFAQSPERLKALSSEVLRREVRQHIFDMAGGMGDAVYLWDVVNDATTDHDIWDKIGWDQIPEMFRVARRSNPRALLSYSDNAIQSESVAEGRPMFEKRLAFLQKSSAPFDVIADQIHVANPARPIGSILTGWDSVARFGKRIEVTDFDVANRDDAEQGAYMRDILVAAFSHPALDGFILAGFWEGDHPNALTGGALVRTDWSYRPAMEAWDNLIFKTWRTNLESTTDANGAAAPRGFYGTYKVRVKFGTKWYETLVGHHKFATGDAEISISDDVK